MEHLSFPPIFMASMELKAVPFSIHVAGGCYLSHYHKATHFQPSECNPDCMVRCLGSLFVPKCGRASLLSTCPSHNSSNYLVGLGIDELFSMLGGGPVTISRISTATWTEPAQLLLWSSGAFAASAARCGCSWLQTGLTPYNVSSSRRARVEEEGLYRCSADIQGHNSEHFYQRCTILERRCLATTLDLYLSKEEIASFADEVLDRDLSAVQGAALPLYVRVRMTWDCVVNGSRHLHAFYQSQDYIVPGLLHEMLSLTRFLVWTLIKAAISLGKAAKYDTVMIALCPIYCKEGSKDPEEPNFLGPRARLILDSLASNIQENLSDDSFIMTSPDQQWLLHGIYGPDLEQLFMGAAYHLKKYAQVQSLFFLSKSNVRELFSLGLEVRIRCKALAHIAQSQPFFFQFGLSGPDSVLRS